MSGTSRVYKNPGWVSKLRDILHAQFEDKLTLENLANELGIHPVHLCRDFTKYFHCNLGDYIRKLRIEKALNLMRDRRRSLTDISLECGFADQSHFLRSFKAINRIKPSQFRPGILGWQTLSSNADISIYREDLQNPPAITLVQAACLLITWHVNSVLFYLSPWCYFWFSQIKQRSSSTSWRPHLLRNMQYALFCWQVLHPGVCHRPGIRV